MMLRFEVEAGKRQAVEQVERDLGFGLSRKERRLVGLGYQRGALDALEYAKAQVDGLKPWRVLWDRLRGRS